MTVDREDTTTTGKKTVTEEVEVSSEKLMDKVKHLANEASVRRVRIKEPDGDIAVDIPLTVGALAGGAAVLAAPTLALLGVVIAFFSKVSLEIVRDVDEEKAEDKTAA